MKKEKRLSDISLGEMARVSEISLFGGIHRRLLDVGLVPGTEIVCVGKSPLGDPRMYLVRGTLIALREKISREIIIK